MKAIVYQKYGSPEVLQLEEIEKSTPKHDEVLVKVHAASVNPYDWHFMRGEPYFMRMMVGLFKPKANGLGRDMAGQVEAVGKNVTQFHPGDEVFDIVRSIGADQVIDYTQEDFTRGEQCYDLIFDNVGNRSLSECRRVLASTGRYVLVGGPSGGRWLGPLPHLLKVIVLNWFVRQKMIPLMANRNQQDMLVLEELLEAGKITPVIDRHYKLSEVSEAIQYLEKGHARGKIVITT